MFNTMIIKSQEEVRKMIGIDYTCALLDCEGNFYRFYCISDPIVMATKKAIQAKEENKMWCGIVYLYDGRPYQVFSS